MRDYGKVHTSFWISDGMRQVSDDARLLALYLLTGQHTNMIGCFRLPDGYVSEDLGWPFERVSKGFDELSSNGFATRDSTSKWVLIRNFMEWNSIDNPNQGISALRLFTQVPDNTSLKPVLARVLANAISHIDSAKLKGSERVIKPFLNQEQEQEQEQEQNNKTPHIDRAGANVSPTDGEPPPEFVDESWPDDPAVKFPMTAGWQPSPDFRQRAALWGKALSGLELGYTPAELASFVAYWQPEGKAFHQAQWELKFADHLRKQLEPSAGSTGGRRRGKFEPSGNYDEKPAGFS